MFVMATAALLLALSLVVVRAIKGPTGFDRVLAGNSIGSLAILLVALLGFLTGRPEFLDIALTYGLLNLIGTLAILKFFRHGDLGYDPEEEAERLMTVLIDSMSWLLLAAGAFFVLVGAVGLLRMPELFTRMHAASVIDTLGVGLLVAGMMLQAGFGLVTLKLLILLALFFFTGPVVTHALAQAALQDGVEPKLSEDRRGGTPPADSGGRQP